MSIDINPVILIKPWLGDVKYLAEFTEPYPRRAVGLGASFFK